MIFIKLLTFYTNTKHFYSAYSVHKVVLAVIYFRQPGHALNLIYEIVYILYGTASHLHLFSKRCTFPLPLDSNHT